MATPQKIYIDEDTGVDETGTPGSEEKPFKSLQFAYIQTDGAGEYFTRKSLTGVVADGADKSTLLEWQPASKAVSSDSIADGNGSLQLYRVSRKQSMHSLLSRRRPQRKLNRLLKDKRRKRRVKQLSKKLRRSSSRKTPVYQRPRRSDSITRAKISHYEVATKIRTPRERA